MATDDIKSARAGQKREDQAHEDPVRDGTLKESRATDSPLKEEPAKEEVIRDGTLKESRGLDSGKKPYS